MSALFAFFMLIGAEMLGANSGLGISHHHILSVPTRLLSKIERMWGGIVTVATPRFFVKLVHISSRKEFYEMERRGRTMKWSETR